ncbi:MAG TPA: hypothetical protein VNJ71_02535 [Gemmatimonadales bacterium]|jgi:hypothetical protein|nr:hypothetical protein [Gemmatimonadales bacterium]
MSESRQPLFSEAVDAGLLGGSTVAIWFLIRDLLAGRPLLTPSVLGQVFILGQDPPVTTRIDFSAVILYTAVHFLAFVAFGFLVTLVVRLACRSGVARFALLVLFVVFELGFYVFVEVAASGIGGLFPLWAVLLANLFAALVMGYYFARLHPELTRALKEEPLGA